VVGGLATGPAVAPLGSVPPLVLVLVVVLSGRGCVAVLAPVRAAHGVSAGGTATHEQQALHAGAIQRIYWKN